ncbi:hypothetical protein ZIOFF_021021 [Zingiber officinale]|uniref:Protein FAR1-RELATED SEQUENCE n=1 Tax=Zingiber officinale TaxID=94328 RepID=A0A8J5LGV4_ZINOF|nr:hypothetical protein ZIOFF_021021 [Zingiber officinale]
MLPSGHVISVLIRMKVIEVPMNYIMDRWRKDIKRGYQSITNIYDEYVCDEERHRYNILTPLIQEVQQLGANNDDSCSILVKILKDAKEKLIAIQTDHSRADQLKEASTSSSKTIHSPLKVRSRGCPPTKRKQSKIEQIVKKSVAKARKKVIEGPTVSVEELTNMENGKHDSLIIHDEQLTKTFFSCCAKSNPRRNAASGDDWRFAFAAGTKGPVNDSFKSSPKSKSVDSRGSSRYSDPAQNGETSLNSDSRRTPDRLPPQPPH